MLELARIFVQWLFVQLLFGRPDFSKLEMDLTKFQLPFNF
jgi:hypothetical protein